MLLHKALHISIVNLNWQNFVSFFCAFVKYYQLMVFVGDVMQSVICKISTMGARGVGYNSVTTIDRFHVQQWINDLISCIVRLTPTHTHTHMAVSYVLPHTQVPSLGRG